MPVGVAPGIGEVLGTKQGQPRFRWGRAVVAGGLAGTIGEIPSDIALGVRNQGWAMLPQLGTCSSF